MLVTIVAGARPNFMKVAPIIKAVHAAQERGANINYRLVHTGQHFDRMMSGDFFDQLVIPQPHTNLGAGGGTQAEQTATILVSFEKELIKNRPDVVLVVGDVTSTMACTISAKKLCLQVVHVEAGIRSGDMSMPEEINRIVTDSICDHFFTTSEAANQRLRNTGIDESRIHFVGNTMIDTLMQNIDRVRKPDFWDAYGLEEYNYFLVTLHRPSNVDDTEVLKGFLDAILNGTGHYRVVFPVHPRTRANFQELNYKHDRLLLIDPVGYLEFIFLLQKSRAIITDSGGVTEEATVLGKPCMTLRDSTERPETISIGTNELVGTNAQNLENYLNRLSSGNWKKGGIPRLWDGRTSERIVDKLLSIYG